MVMYMFHVLYRQKFAFGDQWGDWECANSHVTLDGARTAAWVEQVSQFGAVRDCQGAIRSDGKRQRLELEMRLYADCCLADAMAHAAENPDDAAMEFHADGLGDDGIVAQWRVH